MGSLTGTQLAELSFNYRGDVSVIFQNSGGSIQLIGFTNEDDAIQARQIDDTTSFTKGLYGGITANISVDQMGEVVFKILESNKDNTRLSQWHERIKSGILDPATITIKDTNYTHNAFYCLPVKPPEPQPASTEDASMEWRILVAKIELFKPKGGIV